MYGVVKLEEFELGELSWHGNKKNSEIKEETHTQ